MFSCSTIHKIEAKRFTDECGIKAKIGSPHCQIPIMMWFIRWLGIASAEPVNKFFILAFVCGCLLPSSSSAMDLKQSKFTQVVNNVEVISAADKSPHNASVSDTFQMPDVLRTGPGSRAELAAADGTITRVGANTIFSYDTANRTIDLQQGSLLFHSPHGKGGGTIRTGSATASVIGTTIIITCTPNGGFKLLDLEGQAEVRYLNGLKQTLEPGQMTFILPGGTQSSPVIVFRLDTETKGSTLVSGFTTPLDSQSKINSEITQQLLQILNGTAADTGYIVGENATANSVQVVVANINNTPPPIFSTDGRIVGSDHVSTLQVNYPQLDPAHTFDSSITPLTSDEIAAINGVESFSKGLSFLGLFTPASGFFGNNIDIDTANVDLSSFAGKSDFDIMAAKDLRIWRSVAFSTGIYPLANGEPQLPDVVSIFAGRQMLIASGSTLEADTGTFGLVAGGFGTLNTGTGLADSDYPNALEDVRLINIVGAIQILSLSDFTLEDYGSIYSGNDGTGLGLEIQSEGNLTLGNSDYSILGGPEWNVTIAAGGDVDLVASYNIGMYDTYINAAGGDINITAGRNINIENSDLEASSPESLLAEPAGGATGNVIISGAGVDVENTYIGADGDVGIESIGTLYLGWNNSGDEIDAGGSISLTSDNGDVDVSGYDFYPAGNLDFSSGGVVNVDNVYAEIGGNLNVNAVGDVSVSGSYFDLYNGGSVDVTAGGNIDIIDTGGSGNTSLSINAGGYVNVNDSANSDLSINPDLSIGDWTVTAGNYVDLSADDNLSIENSDIYAEGGDVTITAGGDIDIENSNIHEADASISLNAGGYVNVYDSLDSSDLSIDAWYVTAGTYVDFSADDNLTIEDSVITANSGDVNITSEEMDSSGNLITIGNTSVEASGSVYMTAYSGGVNINDGSSLNAEDGDVNINGGLGANAYENDGTVTGGNVNISGSSVSADHDVTVNGGIGFEGYINGGVAMGGNVDIAGSSISASGDISLNGGAGHGGGALFENNNLTTGGNVEISDGSSISADGDVTVNGGDGLQGIFNYGTATGGNVEIYDSSISAGGDVTINGGDGFQGYYNYGTATGGNVDIENSTVTSGLGDGGGDVNVTSDEGDITIDNGSALYAEVGDMNLNAGGNIDIENSSISAGGTITLLAGGYVNVYDSLNSPDLTIDGWNAMAGTYVDLSADGNLTIEDSDIYGNGGDVALNAGNSGALNLEGSTVQAHDSVNVNAGGAAYLSGDTVTAQNEDAGIYGYYVNVQSSTISAGGNVTIVANYYDYYGDSLTLDNDTITAVGGNADMESYDGMVTLDNDTISASDNVSIEAGYDGYGGGTVTLFGDTISTVNSVTVNAPGDVNIENTGITVGGSVNLDYEGYGATWSGDMGYSTGGDSASIAAGGDVYIDESTINLQGNITFSGSDVSDLYGTLTISAGSPSSISGDGITIDHSTISGGNITVSDSSLLSYYGDLNFYNNGNTLYYAGSWSDVSEGTISLNNIIISGSTITADQGNINIISDGSLSVYNGSESTISDSSIMVSTISISDSVIGAIGGTLDISGVGNVNIEDTRIFASKDIDIFSGWTLTLENYGGYYLQASGAVNLSADGDVDIYGTEIYADGGDLDVYAGTGFTLYGTDTENYSSGTGGTVVISGNIISSAGGVDINGGDGIHYGANYAANYGTGIGGMVDVSANTISAGGNVDVSGGDGITVGGAYAYNWNDNGTGGVMDISASTISAGGEVNINGGSGLIFSGDGNNGGNGTGGTVSISSSSITASGGEVNINGGSGVSTSSPYNGGNGTGGDVDITSESTVLASGDVNINGGSGLVYSAHGDNFGNGVGGTVSISSSSIIASGGEVSINGGSGLVAAASPYNYGVGSGGDVDITSESTVLAGGDVDINTYQGGNIDVENSAIEAGDSYYAITGGSVDIKAYNGNVILKNVVIHADKWNSSGGDVDIFANGMVDAEATYIFTGNSSTESVDVESEGALIFGNETGGTIDSGSVTLTSDSADVDVYGYLIDASGGDMKVLAGAGVDMERNHLGADGIVSISAGGNLILDDNVVWASFTWAADSDISAVGDIDLQNNSIYSYNGNMSITAGGTAGIDDGSLWASGDVNITAGGTVSIASSGTVADTTITAGGSLTINTGTGLTVSGASLNANTTSGTVSLNSTTGQTTINNGSSVQAFYINVNSSDGILLDGTGGALSGNRLDLSSGNADGTDKINVQNADLTAFATVNMAAHTINLMDVAFGGASMVNLHSFFGLLADNPNTGAGSIPGFVNFINGVTYGGTLITSANQSAYVNPGSGPGIYISTLGTGTTSLSANLSAHTIALANVAFGAGSVVNLGTSSGLNQNTGGSVSGSVNFLNGVNYSPNPIQPVPGQPSGGGTGIHLLH
jgi:hypothetical protein